MTYDLAIVGSGGGAFAAAITARRNDLRVALVERDTVGGTRPGRRLRARTLGNSLLFVSSRAAARVRAGAGLTRDRS
jgi:thioredoxin reductase